MSEKHLRPGEGDEGSSTKPPSSDEAAHDDWLVDEQGEESFPGSDPPAY